MLQYWFISCSKCTILMKDVSNRGTCGNGESNVEILNYFEQFFCKPKPALKNKIYSCIFFHLDLQLLLKSAVWAHQIHAVPIAT